MNPIKYPSTGQFRDVIRNVKHQASFAGLDEKGEPIYKQVVAPTLTAFGTVKIHGTNASMCSVKAGEPLVYQSREQIITPVSDNAGFATAMYRNEAKLIPYIAKLREVFGVPDDVTLTIYGEWCGGNIQSGVAVNGLEKMFVVFAVRIGTELETKWIRADNKAFGNVAFEDLSDTTKIYSIGNFTVYLMDIDFNRPELAQDQLGKITLEVERCCPVGKHFGVEGFGEGIVWNIITPGFENNGHVWKVKGEKHSVSKVKTLAAVDVEKITKIRELVDTIMTENRMIQMVSVMKDREGLDTDVKNLGTFLRICMQDALKEELDTIVQNGFDPKEFGKYASSTIRTWYLKQLEL